ncbi:MAG TPA: ribosome biogenesis GTPase Der [Hyphomicrobiales bacterium]|nr:ribosome biogenesis GTPase Der [Rhodobiaceae bacterium]HXK53485.1 ribosome biogenesis GTPase Der [Hyphomicrobiales bacterium]
MSMTIAIIGRPNVGKSTLFNRLAGKRLAIVHDAPGVTRDRKEAEVSWGALKFRLIDTAGLDESAPETLEGRMRAQSEVAIAEADLCLFLIDARAGVTPTDEHFASLLRKAGRPTLLLANKCEGKAAEAGLYEAFSLGLGEPMAVSAEHGEGVADLYQALQAFAQERAEAEAGAAPPQASLVEDWEPEDGIDDGEADERPAGPLRIAVVGRPNAGKSTLINRLIGSERLLTGPEAGITRDSIRVPWQWRGHEVALYDTAGLRKKARVSASLEKLSVGDTLHAIRFAEIVILLIDAGQPFEKQDLQIADLIVREGRALIVGVNKWDLVADKQALRKQIEEEVERLLPQVRGLALIPVSAATGKGLDALMKAVFAAAETWNRRVPTAALNRWLTDAVESHPPPAVSGRRIRLRYMTQAKARPPTFVAFCQRADALPESYVRYMINSLRGAFDLWGTPIRLHMRKGENPYAEKKR